MSSYPALPLFHGPFLADTAHLRVDEVGAYGLLLMAAWRSPNCCLNDDDGDLAQITRLTPKRWLKMRATLAAFWIVEGGRWIPAGGPRSHASWLSHPCRWMDGDWKMIRQAVFGRDGRTCAYCKSAEGPFDIDHIVPRSRGGTNTHENLCVSCSRCNRSKGSKLVSEWL